MTLTKTIGLFLIASLILVLVTAQTKPVITKSKLKGDTLLIDSTTKVLSLEDLRDFDKWARHNFIFETYTNGVPIGTALDYLWRWKMSILYPPKQDSLKTTTKVKTDSTKKN